MKGSVYVNNGYWWYAVRLPGEKKRKARKLCAPNSETALHADRSRDVAVTAARRVWESATRKTPTIHIEGKSVDEICGGWIGWCETYYRRKDGSQTGEAWGCQNAIRLLRKMYGDRPVAELQHADMLAVRDALVRSGIARVTVNRYMERIRRLWRWALDEGHITATHKAELSQVQNLKAFRSEAHETEPVRPVDDADIEATCAAMARNTADLVRVQRLTGMRPGEACGMAWALIDTTATPWVYRPSHHKTEWKGKIRAVLIGPRARAILEKYRAWPRPFSPQVAFDVETAHGAEGRRGVRGIPDKLTDAWDTARYGCTVRDAARRADVAPWSPNQLRHSFATEVRRKHGILMAAMLMGHSGGLKVTQGYSREAAVDELVRECGSVIEEIG